MRSNSGNHIPDALQAIAECLDPDARVLNHRTMTGGSSAVMTALDMTFGDTGERTVIVRQCGGANLAADPHAAMYEYSLLQALTRRGLPVPEALHVDESRTILPAPFLVISHLSGAPDYDPDSPLGAAQQMAAFLAMLHGIDPGEADLNFVARPDGGPRYLEIDRTVLPEAFLPAHDVLQTAWPPPNPNGPRLLHGDLWPGNLLWQEGRLTAVVDWEDAAIGDPMADLAIARVDMSWSFGFEALDAFTRDYRERTGFDLATLPLWDLRAILRQVPHAADYAEGWQELGREDITDAVIQDCHLRLMRQATAALQG